MEKREGLLAAVSAVAFTLLLSAWLHWSGSSPNIYSDLTQSFWGRCWVQAGSLPYVQGPNPSCDYSFEYPAISGLILYVVRALGPTLLSFYSIFAGLVVVAGVVLAWASWAVAKARGRDLNPMYFVMPSFLIYGVYNFDVFHAALILLSLLAFVKGRPGLAAVFLGLAVDTKLTSVVLLPIFLLSLKSASRALASTPTGPGAGADSTALLSGVAWLRRNSSWLRYLVIFAATVAAFNLPIMLLNFDNFLRGYQFIGGYGLEDAWYGWIFQSPSDWGDAKVFGLGISALLLLRVYTMKASVEAKSLLATGAYLLGTYIYAPQFNILLLPLLAVVDHRDPWIFPWDGFNALIILTWFIQPSFILGGACPDGTSWCPTLAGTWPQLFALLRTGSLALVCLSVASAEGASPIGWLRAKVHGLFPSGR